MKALATVALLAAMAGPAQALNLEKAGVEDPAKQSAQAAQPAKSDPAPSAAAGDGKCGDDDRLASIDEWAGKGIKGQKVTITPETYLGLDPDIRAAIGAGEVVVCPNIGIKKGGLPSRKIEVPFRSLMTALKAAAESDKPDAALKALVKTFKAAPLPPKEIVALAVQPPQWKEAIGLKVFKVLNLGKYYNNSDRSSEFLIFMACGGQPTEKGRVLCSDSVIAEEDLPAGAIPLTVPSLSPLSVDEHCARLRHAGLNAEVRK